MIEVFSAILGHCKCDHVWLIRVKIPKYCPKCHRRTDESAKFVRIHETVDTDNLEQEPKKGITYPINSSCVPGALVSDIIKKEENE
jgi:hypothetical protein